MSEFLDLGLPMNEEINLEVILKWMERSFVTIITGCLTLFTYGLSLNDKVLMTIPLVTIFLLSLILTIKYFVFIKQEDIIILHRMVRDMIEATDTVSKIEVFKHYLYSNSSLVIYPFLIIFSIDSLCLCVFDIYLDWGKVISISTVLFGILSMVPLSAKINYESNKAHEKIDQSERLCTQYDYIQKNCVKTGDIFRYDEVQEKKERIRERIHEDREFLLSIKNSTRFLVIRALVVTLCSVMGASGVSGLRIILEGKMI